MSSSGFLVSYENPNGLSTCLLSLPSSSLLPLYLLPSLPPFLPLSLLRSHLLCCIHMLCSFLCISRVHTYARTIAAAVQGRPDQCYEAARLHSDGTRIFSDHPGAVENGMGERCSGIHTCMPIICTNKWTITIKCNMNVPTQLYKVCLYVRISEGSVC